jgi:hypothetical protein
MTGNVKINGKTLNRCGFLNLTKAVSDYHYHRPISSIAISSNQKYKSNILAADFNAYLKTLMQFCERRKQLC